MGTFFPSRICRYYPAGTPHCPPYMPGCNTKIRQANFDSIVYGTVSYIQYVRQIIFIYSYKLLTISEFVTEAYHGPRPIAWVPCCLYRDLA